MQRDDDDATLDAPADPGAPTAAATGPSDSTGASFGGPRLARYKLGAVLGRGGMGEVVSAYDEQIGRSVAIKRLRAATPSTDALARFLREAQIQGRLEHPAIVPVHELARDPAGMPFFVMKQLAGTTLAEVLARLAAGDAKTVAEFTRQRLLRAFAEVCLAAEFAHTRGIIHRDLKPANIVLGEFGEVFVLDWGIARVADEARTRFGHVDALEEGSTIEGAILGTPGYMSPEQIDSAADLDRRADVYALGCILFEILTLQPLHTRGSGLASGVAGNDALPSQRAPDRDIPPELDAACATATALARDERYPTARALGDVIQRFLDGDRDVALRARLAGDSLSRARALLVADANDERGDAMRAAAHALALDPRSGAGELIVGLMLRPPRDTPREVEHTLVQQALQRKLDSRRLLALAGGCYASFVPLLLWAGFAWWQVSLVGLSAATMISIGLLATARTVTQFSWIAIAINVFTIVLAGRFGSPFLLATPLAVITAMAMAQQGLASPHVLIMLFSLALIVPWVGEQVGLLAATLSVSGTDLVLHTGATQLDSAGAPFTLAWFAAIAVTMAVVLARLMANQRLAAQRTTEIQAWRLRKLVPE